MEGGRGQYLASVHLMQLVSGCLDGRRWCVFDDKYEQDKAAQLIQRC